MSGAETCVAIPEYIKLIYQQLLNHIVSTHSINKNENLFNLATIWIWVYEPEVQTVQILDLSNAKDYNKWLFTLVFKKVFPQCLHIKRA